MWKAVLISSAYFMDGFLAAEDTCNIFHRIFLSSIANWLENNLKFP